MKIKPLPSSLTDLPVFSYSRATKDASVSSTTCPRNKTYKATSLLNGKEQYTRRISQNTIDLGKWEGVAKPPTYPDGLKFPEDLLKAVLYSRKKRSTGARTKKVPKKHTCGVSSSAPTDSSSSGGGGGGGGGVEAPKPAQPQPIAKEWAECASCKSIAETSAQLCACTAPPWSNALTETWREKHVELRHISPVVGLSTYALRRLRAASVLGEYVGELVSGREVDMLYLLSIPHDAGTETVFIDALRVGAWTRFINHSCRANTFFESCRVGEELRVVVVTNREVRKGEEVTVDYGEQYWEAMNRRGVWCVCGEKGCRFSEPLGKARVERARRSARRREAR